MEKILKEFFQIGIVPVLELEDAKDVQPLAKALMNGGLPCAEVTFRTEAAEESIRIMTDKFPEMLVGAGTVLTEEQADRAADAGAKFIVSPGLNPRIVKHCMERNIPILPGCANPSDIEQAIELGLSAVKFFPAEANGGLAAIKAMAAPYYNMKFMPTGGINAGNVGEYLDFKPVIACGGSFVAPGKRIKEKDWEGITRLTREAVSDMLGFQICHVGINHENETVAIEDGKKFAALFGAELCIGNSSIFASSMIEMMKRQGRGLHGHIAVGTKNVERAVYHLTKRGFSFDEASSAHDADGSLKSIYLAEEIAGFAVHLLRRE